MQGLRILVLIVVATLVGGCSTAGYYVSAAKGQFELMSKREPVSAVLARDDVDPQLKERLLLTQEMRDFATRDLLLPDNASYRSYADLGRPHAVWNVIAAPEFSVTAKRWCFPVAGCVSYRGYFSREAAEAYAQRLRNEGYDVQVAGASAYSTLGWFSDPLLSTMLGRPDHSVAGLMFHELAHQKLYVGGDSAFNEAFATVVEREGTRRWLVARGDEGTYIRILASNARREAFFAEVVAFRERLAVLYAMPLETEEMRARKAAAFAAFRADYQLLKAHWGGYDGFDWWVNRELNNAHLSLVATYNQWVPALETLLAQHGGDLAAFYAGAAQLAKLPYAERRVALAELGAPQATAAALQP